MAQNPRWNRNSKAERYAQFEDESEDDEEEEMEEEKKKPVPPYTRDHVGLFHNLINNRVTREEFMEQAKILVPNLNTNNLKYEPDLAVWMEEETSTPGPNAKTQDDEMDVDPPTMAAPDSPFASSRVIQHTREESGEEPPTKRRKPLPRSPPPLGNPGTVQFNANSAYSAIGVEYNVLPVSNRRTIEDLKESSSEEAPKKKLRKE